MDGLSKAEKGRSVRRGVVMGVRRKKKFDDVKTRPLDGLNCAIFVEDEQSREPHNAEGLDVVWTSQISVLDHKRSLDFNVAEEQMQQW
jgi:hypothetical protein